jgi:phosphoribosylformylglycinamidine synthase
MHRQIIYRYCDATGGVNQESNPNGAIHNIAGICNKTRNVFGMMPHPEREPAQNWVIRMEGRSLIIYLVSNYHYCFDEFI